MAKASSSMHMLLCHPAALCVFVHMHTNTHTHKHTDTHKDTSPVGYIGKSIGCVSRASVNESMRTVVRLPMEADFRDLNLEISG